MGSIPSIMSITRKQSATVRFPWSDLEFMTMEPRPVHKPMMVGEHDEIEIRTEDGTIVRWLPNGDVIRKEISGRKTRWWAIPTMEDILHRKPEGVYCRFFKDGTVTMSWNGLTWFWGPLIVGEYTVGGLHVVSCSCDTCSDDGEWDRCSQTTNDGWVR